MVTFIAKGSWHISNSPFTFDYFGGGKFHARTEKKFKVTYKSGYKVEFFGDNFKYASDGFATGNSKSKDYVSSWKKTKGSDGELVMTGLKVKLSDFAKAEKTKTVVDDHDVWISLFKGSDTFKGGDSAAGNDYIFGYDGNDRIYGYRGDDHLDGGRGADTLSGGAGRDVIFGGAGQDKLYGGSGDDKMQGGTNNDRLYGGDGKDILDGGDGDDRLSGEAGNDDLSGGKGNDVLYGGSGNDYLYGNTGNDVLFGGAGNDKLFGDAGNDRLYGGTGRDELTGGAGADRFVFTSINDSRPSAPDIVRDLHHAEGDKIDLRAIDADTTRKGDQAFTFIGSSAFNKKAGELLIETDGFGNTTASGDVNGDGKADFTIGIVFDTLGIDDFLL